LQDEASQALLAKHDIHNTTVCGDPRFDRVVEIAQEAKHLPVLQQFAQDAPVIVAGSTWLPDEELLARYFQENEEVKLVIVPHETDKHHLHALYHLLQGRYVRYTEATPQNLEFARCLVVDTVGILANFYRYATVAYVGGGFGVGIHNTLEAAVYGCPVVFGPNYGKFREAHGLIASGGGYSVKNYKIFKETMDNLLQDQQNNVSRPYVLENCGATEVIFKEIMK
jgi:3-deoxy-D-manno-octulosonic-acid transferase